MVLFWWLFICVKEYFIIRTLTQLEGSKLYFLLPIVTIYMCQGIFHSEFCYFCALVHGLF